MVEQAPGVVEQNVAQHGWVARRQRVMNGLAWEALRHPAFRRRAVNVRQLGGQFPLAALAQETTKQRVVVEPLAGIIHALHKQPLTLNFLQTHLTILFTGYPGDQRVVH